MSTSVRCRGSSVYRSSSRRTSRRSSAGSPSPSRARCARTSTRTPSSRRPTRTSQACTSRRSRRSCETSLESATGSSAAWQLDRSGSRPARRSTTCSAERPRRPSATSTSHWASRRGRGSNMPRRSDLKKILVVGAGPIVIGQGCEFDYSGTQGVRALKAEGYEVALVNSNPATIMTDPELADRTYVEPLDVRALRAIVEKERPSAILPTLGGQTALNLALALHDDGTLERFGVELLAARPESIRKAEDRALFKEAMEKIGLEWPKASVAR